MLFTNNVAGRPAPCLRRSTWKPLRSWSNSHEYSFLRPFILSPTFVDSLEGYPIFLPLQSKKAWVEFVQTPERLAGGWCVGVPPQLHARAGLQHGNGNVQDGKLAIEAHPVNFLTPFVHSSTPVEAMLHPESGGGTLFNPLSFTTTPSSRLISWRPYPLSSLHFTITETSRKRSTALGSSSRLVTERRRRARAEQNALEKREDVVLAGFVLVSIFHLRRRRGRQIRG